MKLLVLMQNDYPNGIYTTEALAKIAADAHYQQHYKGMTPHLTLTQADYHYRTYEFIVGMEAK